jgi:tetratricopeptide (TPR) repeat protein
MAHDADVEQLIAAALAHHEAGRLDLAEAGYRAALTQDPDDPDALNLLGLILQGRGELEQSVTLIRRALAIDPDFPEALTNLARGLRASHAPAEAVEAARRAVALEPKLVEAHLQLGGALGEVGDGKGAVEVLQRAAGVAPGSIEVQVALGAALIREKDHGCAVEAWQAALALKPDDPRLLIDLAVSLGTLGRLDEALGAFRRADAVAPDDVRIQFGMALCLVRSGDIPAAAEACRRVVEIAPGQPKLWVLLAECETKLGHFEAAAEAYRRTLTLEPGSVEVLHDLAAIGEGLEGDTEKDAVRAVLGDDAQPVESRVAAGFALGRSCDQEGAYDDAFAAYATANRLARAEQVARDVVFDRDTFRSVVDWMIAATRPKVFADTAGWGDPSELPVFIVGMPRSGTTLVEQIAASHRLVFGAGERKDIEGILTRLGGGQWARPEAAWDRAAVRREAGAQVRRLQALGGSALRVIDKMPDNVLSLGFISILFPRARIVLCRRDPRDVGLSCFFQGFRDVMMSWANDLADCGFRARQVERLVQHWREVLPVPILEIEYETLVADLEGESRRLIDFLGLEWDPACLAFHETERAVLTASYWQVRQPLYASSAGRWRRYRHHIGPLLRELEAILPRDVV